MKLVLAGSDHDEPKSPLGAIRVSPPLQSRDMSALSPIA